MAKSDEVLIANDFHSETVAILDEEFHAHKLWLLSPEEKASLVEEISPTCKAVATASWVTDPIIYELPELEIISCFGVGVDAIDFNITRPRNISVTNTPKVLDDAVADIAIALILASQRNIVNADKFVRNGEWEKAPFTFGNSVVGKTLGILGLGNIGEEIALRALPFKMHIAYHNRHPRDLPYQYYETATKLAANCDILLCMLPGGKETDKLVNKTIFENLGSEGVFVNVGRGTSVDEDALIDALRDGVIAGAALDVYRNEPFVPQALREMDNVILFPHIGSATVETRRAMGQLTIDNLRAWAAQQPLLTIVD